MSLSEATNNLSPFELNSKAPSASVAQILQLIAGVPQCVVWSPADSQRADI